MRQIVQVLKQQQAINDKITHQVPVIVQKSAQEQPKKPKRKGFLAYSAKKRKLNQLLPPRCSVPLTGI